MDIAAEEVTAGGRYKACLGHGLCIGQVELEHVPARLDIKANGQGVVGILRLIPKPIIIFHIHRSPARDFVSATYTQGIKVIVLRTERHQITVDKTGAKLQGQAFIQLFGN